MDKKIGPKISLSFKETFRDIKIYNFLINEIKYEFGISSYIKSLIEKDMINREKEKEKKESHIL